MNLVIVESPTKSKTISKFLNRDYKVLSSYGHIRDLPEKEIGIDTAHNFEPKYVVLAKAKKTVQQLKESSQKAKLIILATDEDREGEAIAWHLCYLLKLGQKKPYQRIVFHEITKKAIEEALKNPRQINIDLVNAQQARRILDRLVGYELSPFLWKKVAKGLSAGRVQSVAVRLIVDREREIEAFKPEEYWTIEAKLKKQKQVAEFTAQLIKKNGQAIPKLGIKTKQEADKILKDLDKAEYQVVDVVSKEIQKYPYSPFITSTLQQEAVRKLGFSAKQTMRIAQQLYEGIELAKEDPVGLITYHRTDSLNISQGALKNAQEFIRNNFGQNYALTEPRIYKTKSKSAQEAHEAIRPTQIDRQPDQIKSYLDHQQYKLYNLIWRRFIACQMKPACFDSTIVEIKAQSTKEQIVYTFRAAGQTLKFDGFLKVYPLRYQEAELPLLEKQEILELIKLLSQQHFTQPPTRYNEASLVKILEEYGIGRPSTYAPIISTIQDRGYVEKNEQKRFEPTEIGLIVIDLLKENFPQIVDIKFTAYLENDLDKIANEQQNWLTVLTEFYQPFHENLLQKYQTVEKKKFEQATQRECPKCGSPLVIKLGRFGKFYACSAFPKCKYTEPIINSTGIKCPQCQIGELIEKKTKKGKIFYACSRYPECQFALWDKPIDEKCPLCQSILVQGKNHKIKCSNPACQYQKEKT